ncbi:hypothetical protein GGG16DRAFT_114883 [Schizophyllum commune]
MSTPLPTPTLALQPRTRCTWIPCAWYIATHPQLLTRLLHYDGAWRKRLRIMFCGESSLVDQLSLEHPCGARTARMREMHTLARFYALAKIPPTQTRTRADANAAGAKQGIQRNRRADDTDELKIACTEWFWGLKRGGLQYQLATAHNQLFFRRDIAHLYASFQFILAPTFKTFLDILDLNQRAGILRRTDDDISPRRPLTALTPPSGFYRYVFIPMTDAARQLQKEFNLAPQTEEDLNGGLDARSKRPLHEGTEASTVVECFAHPYCVSTLAEHAFNFNDDWATPVTAQWSLCTLRIVDLWHHRKARDVPGGAGYTISRRSQDGNGRHRTAYEGQEALEANVSAWAEKVDPDSKPEEQPPVPRESIPVRRSARIAERANPYQRPKQAYYTPKSQVRKAPWPCPQNEDPYASPPSWATRNGHFPTRGFSTNDWAYFCYSVSLPAPRKTWRVA